MSLISLAFLMLLLLLLLLLLLAVLLLLLLLPPALGIPCIGAFCCAGDAKKAWCIGAFGCACDAKAWRRASRRPSRICFQYALDSLTQRG